MVIMPNYDSLVDYISKKFNFVEVTIATVDGLLVASNSSEPELASALAPEMLKSNKNGYIVFKLNSELIFYAKPSSNDINIDEIQAELKRFLKFN
jgi:hypothetical protein